MRQGNSNKRLRGRNRKGPNPLTKTFESNGPDVKIRGTALHVAEKYLQLSRDAQASGDRVMGENYLQHAEHYFRILAAAQGPNQPQQAVQREEDLSEGYEQRAHNGSGGTDPGQAEQPSDSGYERQNANGGRQRGRRGDGERAPANDGETVTASERSGGKGSERSGGRKANGSAKPEPAAAKPEAAEAEVEAPENAEAPVIAEKADEDAKAAEPVEAAEATEAKPRRRTRTTRSPRTRTKRATTAAEGSDGSASQDSETAASDA
ncbi:DUF4167 domain-containing protein [Amorphus sp. 3PC139-8]|uniref:DUF4167 domain-containing protein n=1 Tax=Amorphus sp. 3PC139-8 TaxID=2735676 RepID=UPI00345DC74C